MYKEQIARIMQKMQLVFNREDRVRCGQFPPEPAWNNVAPQDVVKRYEQKHNILLPEDYKQFITTAANGGTEPFYGLYSICVEDKRLSCTPDVNVSKKFPYTVGTPLNMYKMNQKEREALEINDSGYVLLCHEGCGMYSILIVNTDDDETYGTVWFYDVAHDYGIFPIINQSTNKPMKFLDWLEYYADRTLEMKANEYFSYGELIKEGR